MWTRPAPPSDLFILRCETSADDIHSRPTRMAAAATAAARPISLSVRDRAEVDLITSWPLVSK